MDRLGPTLIIAALVALVFFGMWWGWRRRRRRDSGLTAPVAVPSAAERGETLAAAETFYVATTVHEQPIERLAIAGLSFRGRARVEVSRVGILLQIAGERDVFIAAERVTDVAKATWAIDRVVEKDGLLMVAWRVTSERVADTYLRVIDPAEFGPVLDAVRALTTPTLPTESEA
jgi:hypothetical protein